MSVDLAWLAGAFPHLTDFEPLKAGGQKWAFCCQDPKYGRCVLKLIKPGAGYYLDRELEAVQRLASDNVPRIHSIGQVGSQMGQLVWLLEQYVDGVVLSEKIRQGPMNKDEILTLALDLVSAARDAESVEVVHRDIKPDNVKVDMNGKAWLLDFGIARILDLESKTRTDQAVGPHSPGYSPPEQFNYRKRDISGRSDLFAIGVVLYECATGTNPFLDGARDRQEVYHRVEQMRPARLALPWDDDGEFADFVAALAQKFPHQRPSTCGYALAWLEDIVSRLGGQ